MTATAHPSSDYQQEQHHRVRGTEIVLAGVTKDFGLAKPAVDRVSLSISPGEFMTLLGPSGSGKTTTLNLIAGFESLSSGTISLDGTDVSRLPPHKRDLGMLFQDYALFPHMTVAQNVAYPLRERKVPRAEIDRRVHEVLGLVQLLGRDDNYPRQLSGGQQQRVALARATVFQPKALLLDEPLGALDKNLRAALQLEIRRIHRELRATFVFVTHDQEEALNLSDRIALFNDGRIEQVGTPEDLYNLPETAFAATFLGDSNAFELPAGSVGSTVGWESFQWKVDPETIAQTVGDGKGGSFIIVRPEAVSLAALGETVPAGMNSVTARVRDIQFMGGHRSLLLGVGPSGQPGKARIGAFSTEFAIDEEITMWWSPTVQRVVAA